MNINQFLQENVMNGCWHEPEEYYYKDTDSNYWSGMRIRCKKCKSTSFYVPFFTTNWNDYGRLLKVVEKKIGYTAMEEILPISIIIDPQRGSEAMAKFFGYEEGR